MNKRFFILTISVFFALCNISGQERMRVILDNDFAGDPDGLFALAQLVESPSVDVRAVIGSHLHEGENFTDKGNPSAVTAVKNVKLLLDKMGKSNFCPIVQGSEDALVDVKTPKRSAATDVIIKEAKQCSPQKPLYVLCGGGLTEIASAWLLSPEIARNVVLVWIGGAEYPGFITPPGSKGGEYNTTIDTHAAQVIFNQSDLKLWQVPRNAYRQCLISRTMLLSRIKGAHPVALYLADMLERFLELGKRSEGYVLGDSPLVLVSALQSNWERDACSSLYTMRPCPTVDDKGFYHFGDNQRKVKVFDQIDTYLMFEDMFAKFHAM